MEPEAASHKCNNPECCKPSTLQCPTCIKLGLEPAYFCSQDCFKEFWPLHKLFHKKAKEKKEDDYDEDGPINDGFKYVFNSFAILFLILNAILFNV